ncbi:MAG TPA: cytochrome P450 [Polyangiaceae bacterium]|jgi:cytochrome P450
MPSYPPGPPGLPVLGSVFGALREPLELFMSATREHGDVVGFHMLHLDYVLLTNPDAIRHVLVENPKNYEKSRNYAGLKVILGQGLVTSEGEVWRRQRKLAQPAFHRERIASFVRAMDDCTSDMLARWDRESIGQTIDVHAEMMRLTFRVVGRALLSRELDGDAKAIGHALSIGLRWANDYAEALVPIPLSVPTFKNIQMKREMKKFDALIYGMIAERRASGPKDDLLSMLLDARDEETGEPMSDKLLRDELITMVSAGHETTANALSFALYMLSKHPEWARRVRDEADAVLGDRAHVGIDDVKKLATAQMVVEETMRLYPPVWTFERRALEADRVGEWEIPKDATVGISPYVLHRSPAIWPNPEAFDPTRFSAREKEARHKHAYLPFGGGPRTCIGNVFAMAEATLVLARIVQRVRLELLPGFAIALDPVVTLRPKGGLPMRLLARQAPERSRRSAASDGVTPLG